MTFTCPRLRTGLLAIAAVVSAGVLRAEDLRRTPLVRALQRAKTGVVNIHSQKLASDEGAVFSNGRGRRVNGMGTGIVVDPRGYIVTNHHVVHAVESLRVTFVDGGTYDAKIVSFDTKHDLAVIKIKPTRKLEVMPMGTSSDLMVGEPVFAVGNAFGYENSVTSGIISQLGRDVEVNEKQGYRNLIQTDASINPGNSGGPLINIYGEVIGINVAIRAGAQRIGFAIPIDDARKVVASLMSVELLDNTFHGLLSRDVKAAKRRELVVASSQPNSPAAKAGFKAGDVIVKVGQTATTDRADLERALLGRKAGEKVSVMIRRGGNSVKMLLTLVVRKGRAHATAAKSKTSGVVFRGSQPVTDTAPADKTWTVLGMQLAKVNKQDSQLTGSRYQGGMRVTRVRPGSPASTNGIREGDVLVGLHLWETTKADDISYVLTHPELAKFNPLKFYILRGRDTLYGYLQLEPPGNKTAGK